MMVPRSSFFSCGPLIITDVPDIRSAVHIPYPYQQVTKGVDITLNLSNSTRYDLIHRIQKTYYYF